jgi:glycine betaine/proline transport system ATP-binding protein
MTIKVRVENLIKIFGNSPKKRALSMLKNGSSKEQILKETGHVVGVDNASFNVEQGEIFVVMGLSGSGKSTLIRCLNRLYEPTSGHVYLDDEEDVVAADASRLQEIRRTRMAMVFQHFGLFPHKTVGYNVSYGLRTRGGMSEETLREKAAEALSLVGLTEWIDHQPGSLSGGMQQRVGLARALAADVDVLLMDEAFSALDPLIRRQMQDELVKLQERLHKTIIFITHDLNEALRVGNHVAIMRDGQIVQIGTPQDIVMNPANEYVARFMADVDQSRILTAEFVMRPAHRLPYNCSVSDAMKRMNKFAADALYLVNKEGMPEGIVRREYLYELQRQNTNDIGNAIIGNFPTVSPLTTLTSLYNLYSEKLPIAVVDSHGRLQGVVYSYDVLEALGNAEEVAVTENEQMQSDVEGLKEVVNV